MAQYTHRCHRTPPNQNPPYLSVYDIVYRYCTIYRCNSIRYRIQYQVLYRVRCLIFHYGQGGLLPALDRDAADVSAVNDIWVNAISYTISIPIFCSSISNDLYSISNVKKAFDIVYDIKARYRIIMFDIEKTTLRYRQPCTRPSISTIFHLRYRVE